MRVLAVGSMYPPHHLGGYELTWRSAMAHLRDRGSQVRVLTTRYRRLTPDSSIPDDPEVFRDLRWYWRDHEFPRLSLLERLGLERHNHALLGAHIGEWRPDVVAWWAMGGMSLTLIEAVRRADIPAVGVVGDDWMEYGPRVDQWLRACGRAGAGGRAILRLTRLPTTVDLAAAGTWLFNSETTRSNAGRAAGVRGDVLHPGVDDDLFVRADPKPWEWRLLYVGRLDSRKGTEIAVGALASLSQAQLTMVGPGEGTHLEELKQLAAEMGVADRISFALPPRSELQRVYADADAVLFPTQWDEPWGLVPLEAMAVGTPVIASGTGGSSEYLRDLENCLIYGPHDAPTALAAATRRLAGNAELRDSVRRGGWDTTSRLTERAYNAAIEAALEAELGPH